MIKIKYRFIAPKQSIKQLLHRLVNDSVSPRGSSHDVTKNKEQNYKFKFALPAGRKQAEWRQRHENSFETLEATLYKLIFKPASDLYV